MKINVSLSITLTIILASFLLLGVLYHVSNKREIDVILNIQKTHALQAEKNIIDFFNHYNHGLQFLAGHKEIKKFSSQSKELLEVYYKTHSDDISGVTLIDKSGLIIQTVPYNRKAIGADVSQQEHNFGKILSPDIILSDVFETAQGFNAISMSLPVFSGDNVNGRVSILFKFERIAERYIKDICRDNPGSAILLSKDGTILYHKDTELIGSDSNSLHIETLKIRGIFNEMSSGKSGTVHLNMDHENIKTETYGFYMPLEIFNNYWSIFIITPADEIRKLSSPLKYAFAAITLAILAAGVFFSITLLINIRTINFKNEELAKSNENLNIALDQVRQLNQLLPICSNCKKIRNDSGYWEQIETYVTDHLSAEFTHSLCPDCAKKLYPGYITDNKKI
jgi:hypothetical protein